MSVCLTVRLSIDLVCSFRKSLVVADSLPFYTLRLCHVVTLPPLSPFTYRRFLTVGISQIRTKLRFVSWQLEKIMQILPTHGAIGSFWGFYNRRMFSPEILVILVVFVFICENPST